MVKNFVYYSVFVIFWRECPKGNIKLIGAFANGTEMKIVKGKTLAGNPNQCDGTI